jgi:pimeloyl-ACP methyl ester carboxylesterase
MKRLTRGILIALAVFLFAVVVGPLLVPVPSLPDTVPAGQLADPDSRFATVHGVRIHYKTTGQGEPVFVLLHGFGASLFSWREVMGPLGEAGTAVAFDRPAFGLTERPMPGEWSGDSPYSRLAQAEQTVGLMDALGIDRAVLVGNSAGGTIALLTTLLHPERVQALVLVDAAVYSEGGPPAWTGPLLTTPQMRRLGPLLVRSIATRGERLIELAWHDRSRIAPEVMDGYRIPLQVHDWDRALWEFTAASRPLDLTARLDEIRAPTLVITGDDDRIVPREQSERLAAELPDTELAVMINCGHLPQEECPQQFLQAVSDFVAGLP